jgi:hypothetical protein
LGILIDCLLLFVGAVNLKTVEDNLRSSTNNYNLNHPAAAYNSTLAQKYEVQKNQKILEHVIYPVVYLKFENQFFGICCLFQHNK